MAAKKKDDKVDLSRRNFMFGAFNRFRQEEVTETASDKAPAASTNKGLGILGEANLAYVEERYEDAVQKYREFLKDEPGNTEARFRVGKSWYKARRYLQAKIEFERILKTDREDQRSILYLGLALARLCKQDKAAVIWGMYFDEDNIEVMREVNIQIGRIESEDDEITGDQAADAVEAVLGELA